MENKKVLISLQTMQALDTARALAACYVVAHHVASAKGLSHGLGELLRFGQEAVLVFFLLSGFVIFANEQHRADKFLRGYILRRIRRIYPPLLLALIVSTLISYSDGNLDKLFSVKDLAATLLCLQDISFLKPGVIAEPYLGNDPLWSLSYEMFFYLVFPLVLFLWKRNSQRVEHCVGFIACTAYIIYSIKPNHFSLVTSYFLIWWAGAIIANAYINKLEIKKALRITLLWLGILCFISLANVIVQGFRGLGYYPFLMFRHFFFSVLVVLIFFTTLGRMARDALSYAHRFTFNLASISYGLYVLHFPILTKWEVSRSSVGFIGAAVLLLVLSYGIEKIVPKYLPKAPIR